MSQCLLCYAAAYAGLSIFSWADRGRTTIMTSREVVAGYDEVRFGDEQ